MKKHNKTHNVIVAALIIVATVLVSRAAICNNDGIQQEKQLTPLRETQLLRVLRDGHDVVFGFEPSKNRLSMAWAQVALENGSGKVVWNYNLGNIGPGSRNHNWYKHSQYTNYRAFDGFLDGAIAYWKFIKRCSIVQSKFDSADVVSSSETLKKCGYYGVDSESYVSVMAPLFWYARTKVIANEIHEAKNAGKD